MADGERDPDRDDVARRLANAGLSGAAFDVDAITADYRERIEMDRTLDALIGPGDPAGHEAHR